MGHIVTHADSIGKWRGKEGLWRDWLIDRQTTDLEALQKQTVRTLSREASPFGEPATIFLLELIDLPERSVVRSFHFDPNREPVVLGIEPAFQLSATIKIGT